MRRGSKIALLGIGGGVLLLFSAAAAFLIGHGVGVDERLSARSVPPAREQAALASADVSKAAFQSWSLACRKSPDNERRCVLFLAIADSGSKQVLLTLSVAQTQKGMPMFVVETPAGALTDKGVTVTAGAAEALKIPIRSCGPQRCRAMTDLTSSLRAALENAEITSVTYTKADNQQSTYNLPTRGFKDGIAAWFAGDASAQPVSAAVN